jgi:hypothetical protein
VITSGATPFAAISSSSSSARSHCPPFSHAEIAVLYEITSGATPRAAIYSGSDDYGTQWTGGTRRGGHASLTGRPGAEKQVLGGQGGSLALATRAAPNSFPAATTGDAPPVLPCTYVPQEKTRALRKLPPAASGAACCHSRAVGGGDIEPRGRSRCAAAPNYRAALGPHQAMCSIVTAHLVPCRAPGVRVISAPIRPRFDDRLSMTGSSDSFDRGTAT